MNETPKYVVRSFPIKANELERKLNETYRNLDYRYRLLTVTEEPSWYTTVWERDDG